MADYYVRFADLLTDADVAELGVTFKIDRRIIVPGAFSCDIDIPNTTIGGMVSTIIPQKTVAHVYRNDVILGSYVVWTKELSGSNSQVKATLQGAGLESLFYHVQPASNLTYASVDQLDIADDFVSKAQAGVGPYTFNGDFGIGTSYSLSGINRDRSYLASDSAYFGSMLEDLANCDAGFEYVIHTYHSGATRTRTMFLQYDKLHTSTIVVAEEPGGITSWKVLYDGLQGGTVFRARGQTTANAAGEASEPTVSAPVYADAFLNAGWPILEVTADYQNASLATTLDKYAAWWAANRSGPIMIPTFEVNASYLFEHGFSPWSLGATFKPVLNNPAFPLNSSGEPTFDYSSRIIGFDLSVDAVGKEDMNIVVETEFDPTEV